MKNINWDSIVIDTEVGYVNDDFLKNIKTYREVKSNVDEIHS